MCLLILEKERKKVHSFSLPKLCLTAEIALAVNSPRKQSKTYNVLKYVLEQKVCMTHSICYRSICINFSMFTISIYWKNFNQIKILENCAKTQRCVSRTERCVRIFHRLAINFRFSELRAVCDLLSLKLIFICVWTLFHKFNQSSGANGKCEQQLD